RPLEGGRFIRLLTVWNRSTTAKVAAFARSQSRAWRAAFVILSCVSMATRSLSRSAGDGPSMWLWLGISLAVVLLDQFAKALIVGDFRIGESRTVTSFFDVA